MTKKSKNEFPNIKLLEIVKSPWDPYTCDKGYQEAQYRNMECLDGGVYFEDEEEISLKTTNNFEYGYLKEGFLDERTREYLTYETIGSATIKKYIDGSNIIEISYVGIKCKVKIDNLYIDTNFNYHTFDTVTFSEDLLRLFCDGMRVGFIPPSFGYIEKVNKGFKVYFEGISLLQSTINRYYSNGTLAQSDGYLNWLKIRELINSYVEERNISIDKLETLGKFNYSNYQLYIK